MNSNRILGIFISVTILMWILVFALSPQPKYQSIININIPDLPEPEEEPDLRPPRELRISEARQRTPNDQAGREAAEAGEPEAAAEVSPSE